MFHSLKSSSLPFGAGNLAELCKQVELKAKVGQLAGVDEMLDS
jgi:HPt (histidine-containing phosphotransfer) domain-containing protein